MKETLGMYWAKIFIPILFTTITAIVTYFYHHEIRTDEIEIELHLLQERVASNKEETAKFLKSLEAIAKGVHDNSEAIINLNHQVSDVVQKNNIVIERLLNAAERNSQKP